MRTTAAKPRRLFASMIALLAVVATLVSTPAPVNAAPNEGGTKALREALEKTAKAHIEATIALNKSKKRQTILVRQLGDIQKRIDALSVQVGEVAAHSYRMGRLTPVTMLLNSASPDAFLERASGLEILAQHDGKRIRDLAEAKQTAAQAKVAIDKEVLEQRKQVAILAQRKRDAERALAAVSSGPSGGYYSASSPLAKPAPRNADGSWPSESCSVDDPTTSGCITPRTLHALQQAQAAGYRRYVSCYRSGGDGEHPKGRACDFSAAASGFKDETATGGDKTYGDAVAAFFVKNASRLGVLYVIWYRQIWMPNTGWRAYSGSGSPAADHTNHVHLSMY